MRGGFRWDAGGVGSARRRDMRVSLHRMRNCGSSATLAMRRVVGSCHGSERGIRCGLRPGPWAVTGTGLADAFKFATCASVGIVPPSMGCWSLMLPRRSAWSRIATAACSAWRSAFWSRSWRRRRRWQRRARQPVRGGRRQLPGFARLDSREPASAVEGRLSQH
jgi:hypothetical protein